VREQYIKNAKGDYVNTRKYREEAEVVFVRVLDTIYTVYKRPGNKPMEEKYHDHGLVLMCLNDPSMKVAIFQQNMVDFIHANFDVEAEEQ
jgi:hypothetical protein